VFAISRVWAALAHLHTHASTTGQTANDHHNQSHSSTDHTDTYGPASADYLVGTANATLTGEIAVGTTPGGELGGTWASPTVDATHSGSAHLALAANAIVLGTAAAAGAAATTLRSNDTIAAFDATVPVTQASADVAATGSVAFAARRDHKHGMPTIPAAASGGTPAVVLGTAAAAGVSATFLRDDDTIVAFDATAPVTQAYSDVAGAGAAAVAARRDHKHGMPAAGAGSDLATTVLAPAGSEALATNLSAVVNRSYTIASGQKLTIGSGARFRIL
jgi:hypothetical protein